MSGRFRKDIKDTFRALSSPAPRELARLTLITLIIFAIVCAVLIAVHFGMTALIDVMAQA